MNSTAKTILFWVALLLTAVLLYQVLTLRQSGYRQAFTWIQFMDELDHGNLKDVTITGGSDINGHLQSGKEFKTILPMEYPELLNKLRDKNVVILGEKSNQIPWFAALFSWALPMLFIIVFWIFFMRQKQSGGRG